MDSARHVISFRTIQGLMDSARHVVLALTSNAFKTLVPRVEWHPMTWRALCISPYHALHQATEDDLQLRNGAD